LSFAGSQRVEHKLVLVARVEKHCVAALLQALPDGAGSSAGHTLARCQHQHNKDGYSLHACNLFRSM
jgi:hypothetical protein